MKKLSPKSRIAMGQVGLLVSLLLTASYLGLIPDRTAAVRDGRAALAEAIAANSSAMVSRQRTSARQQEPSLEPSLETVPLPTIVPAVNERDLAT